ncbi:unnamed protein product [Lactuca virosa]|uniref:Rab-GAP TBC domain-containing protein n=1 Tax=Lactuca virosa TaxID=75947 RepID=A0AAU9P2N0_9ASTR|nr:unnamed protein product [Lactuca virosa]
MFPLVGSGKFITAPVITEDGTPTQDPIVLLEANPEKLMTPTTQATINSGKEISVPKEEDNKIIQWKLTLRQIGLDVVRTDRTLVFYEKHDNLSKLWDVLSVYAWFDKEVGYGQGASVGVESQLCNLANVIQVVDPKLHQHLDHLGGGDYLFAFRMLMMMWALEYDPDLYNLYEEPDSDRPEDAKENPKSSRQCGKFEREILRSGAKDEETLPISVFLVASVLKEKSVKLLTKAKGLDDVVKILNDTSGNLDAKKSCSGAMKLHKKYLKKVKLEKAAS